MKQKRLSTSRRFCIVSHSPADQFGYVESSVKAEPLLEATDTLRQNDHTNVTIEHLFINALSVPISEVRYLNGRIIGGRFYEFDTVDIASVATRAQSRDMSIVKHKNVPNTAWMHSSSQQNQMSVKVCKVPVENGVVVNSFMLSLYHFSG
jgi:hypothetical protein